MEVRLRRAIEAFCKWEHTLARFTRDISRYLMALKAKVSRSKAVGTRVVSRAGRGESGEGKGGGGGGSGGGGDDTVLKENKHRNARSSNSDFSEVSLRLALPCRGPHLQLYQYIWTSYPALTACSVETHASLDVEPPCSHMYKPKLAEVQLEGHVLSCNGCVWKR